MKNSVKVSIFDNDYTVAGEGDENYVCDLAAYVDAKMREISQKRHTLSSYKIAVLAAFNIADELFKAKSELQTLSSSTTQNLDRTLDLLRQDREDLNPQNQQ